jgi:hypothetical protein
VGRKVLTRVLCNSSINFDKPILVITNNRHLEAMAAQHGDCCIPVVWETKEKKDSKAKTVLSSIKNDGQEILADFLGNDPPPYLCSHILYVCADAALVQGKSLWLMKCCSSTFLFGSQSMLAFEINPCKHLTVSALINRSFPAIKSTDNKPTPMVTSKTAGYIHAI